MSEWRVSDVTSDPFDGPHTRVYLEGSGTWGTVKKQPGREEVWKAEYRRRESFWFSKEKAIEAVKKMMQPDPAVPF